MVTAAVLFDILVLPKVENIVLSKIGVSIVFNTDTKEKLVVVGECIISDDKRNVVPSTVLVELKIDDNDENNIVDEYNDTVLSFALIVTSVPDSVINDEGRMNEEFGRKVLPKVDNTVLCRTN
ncbi:hypothetical protein ACJMK2_021109 [Sinanodonta woodiana]|uniref:Uncharacterized protein n=1 Tax=Sinanodonta woodiana TaxID=1069815 RepID=A0ABD3U3H2_SINWO